MHATSRRTPTLATAAERIRSFAPSPRGPLPGELGGMCGDVCRGSIFSFLAFQTATWLGYPDLVQRSPYLSTVIVTVPVPAHGHLHGRPRHGRRHNLKMTGTTIGVGIAVITCCGPASFSTSGLQTGATSSGWSRSGLPAHDRRDVDQLQHVQRTDPSVRPCGLLLANNDAKRSRIGTPAQAGIALHRARQPASGPRSRFSR
jgi:hypothetical protein